MGRIMDQLGPSRRGANEVLIGYNMDWHCAVADNNWRGLVDDQSWRV